MHLSSIPWIENQVNFQFHLLDQNFALVLTPDVSYACCRLLLSLVGRIPWGVWHWQWDPNCSKAFQKSYTWSYLKAVGENKILKKRQFVKREWFALWKLSWEEYPVSRKEFQVIFKKFPSMFSTVIWDVRDQTLVPLPELRPGLEVHFSYAGRWLGSSWIGAFLLVLSWSKVCKASWFHSEREQENVENPGVAWDE